MSLSSLVVILITAVGYFGFGSKALPCDDLRGKMISMCPFCEIHKIGYCNVQLIYIVMYWFN